MNTNELIIFIKKNILRLHRNNLPKYRIFQTEPDRLYVFERGRTSYILIKAVRSGKEITVELQSFRTGEMKTVKVPWRIEETKVAESFFHELIDAVWNIYNSERGNG